MMENILSFSHRKISYLTKMTYLHIFMIEIKQVFPSFLIKLLLTLPNIYNRIYHYKYAKYIWLLIKN